MYKSLPPCPLCGEEARTCMSDDCTYSVGCLIDFRCPNNIYFTSLCGYKSEEDAIRAWLRRCAHNRKAVQKLSDKTLCFDFAESLRLDGVSADD